MSYLAKFQAQLKNQGLSGALRHVGRFLARRLGIPYDVRPYEFVQNDAQADLHGYLGIGRQDIRQIVTVGAHMGYEVGPMLRRYPNVEFKLFEASPRHIARLRRRFAGSRRVQVFECAVSDRDGLLTFHETNLEGSGSLLAVGDLGATSYGMKNAETFTVQARSLDSHARDHSYADNQIDCLWVDVQGAELGVLKGANVLLDKIRAVFIEVSVFTPLYQGGALLEQLESALVPRGFKMVSLGIDSRNGTGNALFVRR